MNSKRRATVCVGWLALCLVSFGTASAAYAQSGVEFGAVDAGTVRVFAVQNVVIEEVQTDRGRRVVALPNMGHGTGFAVPGDDRLLLTAAHVVHDATNIVVRLPGDGAYYPARVAYRDDERDVAVLVIDGQVPPLAMQPATHTLRTRQNVFTVGYPLDASRRQAQSSRGIVGGVRDDGQVQLDMDVNPGNSGGPVIDEADQVVGMLVARGDVANGVQGVAVAVPLATLHDALAQARTRLRDGRVAPLPRDAERAAHVIDALSRVGLMRILREASDVTEGTTDPQTIQEVRALNTPDLLPDMQVFVAAFLWDAAQMLMFRAGDHVSPSTMQVGPTRTLAEELLNEASTLLRAAASMDPTIADRSPFVRVSTGGAAVLVSSEALRPFVDGFPASTATPLPPVPAENWEWRSRRTWSLVAGLGFGAGGLFGRGDEYDDWGPESRVHPGIAVRGFVGVRLAPVSVLSLVFEFDFLVVLKAEAGYGTSPSTEESFGSDFYVDSQDASFGGGGLALLRFYPRGAPFFMGVGARIGAQRFRGRYGGDELTARFLLVQPGGEVGVALERLELGLRFLAGIPEGGKRAGLYTLMLSLGIRLAGGEL